MRPSLGTALAEPFPKKITLKSIKLRINNAAIATVFILPRFVIPTSIQRIMSTPITIAHIQAPVEKMPSAAREPSYIIIAVQPTSCRTFNSEKNFPPYSPKLIFTVSMALLPVFPPIIPAANIMRPPIICPKTIAAIPLANPSEAR